ncbi:MAG: DUF975 family protein [Ruminococcaceae bacterium]|nr:DUF975 family protein [Oscillospiraceae bacterium]
MKSADFRRNAREALKGRWGFAVIAAVIASLLGVSSTPSINFNFTYNFGSSGEGSANGDYTFSFSEIEPALLKVLIIVGSIALIIGLAVSVVYFIISSVVSLGYSKLNLAIVDKRESNYGDLFCYFKNWKAAAKTQLLRVVYIFLWSLLFLIPGIIATYRYALVPYILAEFPEISAKEALSMSKKLMRGNKARLFYLEMSFVGWAILCALSFGIGFLWLNPYISAAKADFYREISGTRPVLEIPFCEVEAEQSGDNDFQA